MLHALQRKSGGATVLGVAADGTRLPLRRRSADAVVMTRLLYLVSEWQDLLREAKGVLKQGGCLFHEWGNGDGGEDWVRIRERARSLFQEAGVASPFHPGARTEDSIDSYLRKIGFRQKERIDGGVGPTMTLGNFLDKIQSGEFSYVWNVPKDVQNACLPQLREWCERTFDLHKAVPIPASIHWILYESKD